MGRAMDSFRSPPQEEIDALAVTPVGPPRACTLNGDVTGNNFHGNYACFDLGIQIGNPAQYAGLTVSGQQTGGGGQIFMGWGPPPPISYDRNGDGLGPPPQSLGGVGSFYLQVDSGSIWWNSGGSWSQKV